MSSEEVARGALLAGRYEIGPVVGRGSTATVHRAHDHVTGDEVAVKLFASGPSPADHGRSRSEIDILTGLRHPGLVAFRDASTTDGRPFVVMDLVEGETLADALRNGPLPAGAAVRLGTELADALAYIHRRGVVHRDIKPANILLDAEGRPRLTDFGIARIDGATRVTSTGVVVGTAAYMAPEQVGGRPVSTPADVYALGLVLLEAATGRREYPGAPVEAAIARLHRSPRVPAGLPAQLRTALRRMTDADPAHRPTAAVVAELLHTATTPGVLSPTTRRLVPLAALTALIAAAVSGYAFLQPTTDPGVTARATPAWVPVAPPDPPAAEADPPPAAEAAASLPDAATAPHPNLSIGQGLPASPMSRAAPSGAPGPVKTDGAADKEATDKKATDKKAGKGPKRGADKPHKNGKKG